MATALIASVVVLVTALVVGFAGRFGSDAKFEGLPWDLQLLVSGLAVTPILHFESRLRFGPVDGLVVAFCGSFR